MLTSFSNNLRVVLFVFVVTSLSESFLYPTARIPQAFVSTTRSRTCPRNERNRATKQREDVEMTEMIMFPRPTFGPLRWDRVGVICLGQLSLLAAGSNIEFVLHGDSMRLFGSLDFGQEELWIGLLASIPLLALGWFRDVYDLAFEVKPPLAALLEAKRGKESSSDMEVIHCI